MKFVLANWGSRGEIEPCLAVGRELIQRGHDVRVAVAYDLVDFAQSTGVPAVGYGFDLDVILEPYRDLWTDLFRRPWRIRELRKVWRMVSEPIILGRATVGTVLKSLAEGADLLITGMNYEDVATNIAEYHGIPLATLHYFPLRPNGRVLPLLPAPLGRWAMTMYFRLYCRAMKRLEDTERRELGLPKTTLSWMQRIADRGSLEIQAYDKVCFPGLDADWAKGACSRPFVGPLTLQLETSSDEEVASWVASGTPPICFGFGSIPVESAADTVAMISAACAQLGERALVCAAATDFSSMPHFSHVKVVETLNYATVFPNCRAVVHHGGAGTTAAGLRAGVPTLVLWTGPDQRIWGAQIKRLKLGATRRFSTTSEKSLVADLRTILAPQYLARARQLAVQMSEPGESIAATADLVESFAKGNKRW